LKLRVGLAIFMVIALAGAAGLYRTHAPLPKLNVTPTQKNPPPLAPSEVANLLGMQYRTIRRVEQVPDTLKQSFANLTGIPFRMVNPGKPMSTDYIIAGVPSRRLVFAGIGESAAVLVYEQGGYANSLNAAVFSYSNGGAAWIATLNGRSVSDIATLKAAVESGQFRSWGKRDK
jgi:hypothetical protein